MTNQVLKPVFFDIIAHEGCVSVVSWAEGQDGHVANTWNSYLKVTDDEKIYLPCYGFRTTEKNVNLNPHIKMTVASKEVQGVMGMGTGCLIKGTARFLTEGPMFDEFKAKYEWASRVLEITPTYCGQTV